MNSIKSNVGIGISIKIYLLPKDDGVLRIAVARIAETRFLFEWWPKTDMIWQLTSTKKYQQRL